LKSDSVDDLSRLKFPPLGSLRPAMWAQWRNPWSLNPRVTLGFNIVESEGKPRVSANTLGFRCLGIPPQSWYAPRSFHLEEIRLYILDDVHARVFTSAKILYYRMQWPTTELVFPLFPTLLSL
jgi:hypothetical protein